MATGCEGCGFPFEFTEEASWVLPIWMAGDCTWSGTLPMDGQPDATGQLIRFAQQGDANRCAVTANWTGPLVDMDATRSLVELDLADAGVDPSAVGLRITAVTPTLELSPVASSTASSSSTHALLEGTVVEYAGDLAVDGSERVVSFAFVAPGDPLRPDLRVSTTPELLDVVNHAWNERLVLMGDATGRVVVDLGALQTAPEIPLVEMRMSVTVVGEVFAAAP